MLLLKYLIYIHSEINVFRKTRFITKIEYKKHSRFELFFRNKTDKENYGQIGMLPVASIVEKY